MEKFINRYSLDGAYTCLNNCLYITPQGTIYKNCDGSINCPDFLSERISFVASLPEIEGFTRPISILRDDQGIYGYEMDYLRDYQTLQEVIYLKNRLFSSRLSFDEKKELLLKLHTTLRKLNRDYAVGDIRLQNIMLNSNDAKIIDWENGAPLNSAIIPYTAYGVSGVKSLTQSDAIKMFYESLSLLYNINFEKIMSDEDFCEMQSAFPFPTEIKDFIDDYMDILYSHSSTTIYFDEYLKKIRRQSAIEVMRVRKRAQEALKKGKI